MSQGSNSRQAEVAQEGTSGGPTVGQPLPTRERQRLDTRNLILEVALAEIARVGFAKARIEHIAQKAGVTRPTFYAHFPTKEDLLRELQDRTEAGALVELRRRLDDSSSPHLVHRLADAIFDLLAAADPVLRREVFALVIREPRKTDWMGNALFGFLTHEFQQAQERGEIAATVPAVELTRIVMTAIFGFLVIESEPPAARRKAAHQMLELLMHGARE